MKRIAFLLFLGIIALIAACSQDTTGEHKANQPPTVWLSAGPPEGSTSKYRVQMFWGGWDPDGEIEGYEYMVTDNETGIFNPADTVGLDWTPVAGNDSTFVFSADQPVDTLTTNPNSVFTRSHTFFVRSIDTEGLRSRQPAYRSFTSRTISPDVTIDVPVRYQQNPADVPPITTFRWHAKDFIDDLLVTQDPESVQFALVNTASPDVPGGGVNNFEAAVAYLRTRAGQKAWYPFEYYRAPEDSGKFWTSPPLDIGTYVFAIRAKDEAGAITPTLDESKNWRRLRVRQRNTGPVMTVTNDYLDPIRTVSCSEPVRILDSPAGVALEFRLAADASSYGGDEAGYRYGWDILDLNDPEQWDIDLTPFLPTPVGITPSAPVPPRTFFFGTHTLTMEVVDNSGYCTRVTIKVNIIQFTLERALLIVDDDTTDEGASSGFGQGLYPNDAEHDAFWMQMASEVSGFDPEIDMIDTKLGDVPLGKMAQYKSIIWVVSADVGKQTRSGPPELLYKYITHRSRDPRFASSAAGGKVKPNVLALAMAAGGHIMVCGKHPIQLVENRSYVTGGTMRFPIIFKLELDGDQINPAPELDPATGDYGPVVGELSFAYRELCLETVDYAYLNQGARLRKRVWGPGKTAYCSVEFLRNNNGNTERDDTMREAFPIDPNFEPLHIRSEVSGPSGFYNPDARGLDVEVYNAAYFRRGSTHPAACVYVPPAARPCFQPIYGCGSNDIAEPTWHQPVAFWTTAYANRVAEVPGAVAARSLVWGFEPVLMEPVEVQKALNHVFFDEWKLTRGSRSAALRAVNERLGGARE
jgi:hypothetical protein